MGTFYPSLRLDNMSSPCPHQPRAPSTSQQDKTTTTTRITIVALLKYSRRDLDQNMLAAVILGILVLALNMHPSPLPLPTYYAGSKRAGQWRNTACTIKKRTGNTLFSSYQARNSTHTVPSLLRVCTPLLIYPIGLLLWATALRRARQNLPSNGGNHKILCIAVRVAGT